MEEGETRQWGGDSDCELKVNLEGGRKEKHRAWGKHAIKAQKTINIDILRTRGCSRRSKTSWIDISGKTFNRGFEGYDSNPNSKYNLPKQVSSHRRSESLMMFVVICGKDYEAFRIGLILRCRRCSQGVADTSNRYANNPPLTPPPRQISLMLPRIVLLLFLLSPVSLSFLLPPTPPPLQHLPPLHLTPQFAEPLLQSPLHVYLDVRTPQEFQFVHIPNSIHVPAFLPTAFGMTPVPNFTQQVTEIIGPPGTKILVVTCKVGIRSAAACEMLEAEGWVCENLEGGMDVWQIEGRPVEIPEQPNVDDLFL